MALANRRVESGPLNYSVGITEVEPEKSIWKKPISLIEELVKDVMVIAALAPSIPRVAGTPRVPWIPMFQGCRGVCPPPGGYRALRCSDPSRAHERHCLRYGARLVLNFN